TGAVAPEGAAGDKGKEGVHTVVAGAADGIRHLFHRSKPSTVEGGEETGAASPDVLKDFTNGTRVVVHYSAECDPAGRDIDAVVTRVDREAKTVRIRLADGTDDTLQLLPAVTADADDAVAADAIVSYTDRNGRRQSYYFTRR